jgi:hypothetical protein
MKLDSMTMYTFNKILSDSLESIEPRVLFLILLSDYDLY